MDNDDGNVGGVRVGGFYVAVRWLASSFLYFVDGRNRPSLTLYCFRAHRCGCYSALSASLPRLHCLLRGPSLCLRPRRNCDRWHPRGGGASSLCLATTRGSGSNAEQSIHSNISVSTKGTLVVVATLIGAFNALHWVTKSNSHSRITSYRRTSYLTSFPLDKQMIKF